MMRRSVRKVVLALVACLMTISFAGCSTKKEPAEANNVFKAENPSGYVFELHVDEEGKVVKVVENGEEYDEESIAGVQTVIDDLGLNVFYEVQSFAVSKDEGATVTYNGEEYSQARKELFADYLNVTKCSKTDGDMIYDFDFETEGEKIVGMTLNFLYKGDFTMFKGNEDLIMSVIDYVKALVAASFEGTDLSSKDVNFEILDEGMHFHINVTEELLEETDADLITAIISLTDENQGFVCE